MKQSDFVSKLQEDRIVQAIRDAEAKSAGEIRVYISERVEPDAVAAARAHFDRLNMSATAARNGVLVFIAPESQTFAVIGDHAAHQHAGDDFWKSIADQLTARFKAGEPTEAIVAAVARVGDLLSRHFPRSPDDRNELPDRIERGP